MNVNRVLVHLIYNAILAAQRFPEIQSAEI
ncbi:hypothetical protein LMG27174_06524 [Paraburkholderia rhynchosiae]|uniref:Uncharacterized protein n=1 Tax=Paraburkholderia rhynchosiae TaxID=487049 RepID=A0A6J5CMK4_9BURK|nr:hypothetical protein LMG27174_06524 [Paraburkholderia rhynchosiae]